jgi:hypothetical protein
MQQMKLNLRTWRGTKINKSQYMCLLYKIRSLDSSVLQRWATGWMIGGSSRGRCWEFFSSPPRPDRLRDPLILLSNGYHGLSSWG